MSNKKDEDVIEILGSHDDHAIVRRTRNGEEKIGCLAKTKDGVPIDPDKSYVHLEPREGEPNRYNVKTLYEGKKGPARAATPSYREGWDNIFGKKNKKLELN